MYLYGASGHAKVIIEILECLGITIDGLFDDNVNINNLLGYQVKPYEHEAVSSLIISIGNNAIRKKIAGLLNVKYGCAFHPSTNISRRSVIGDGTVVMSGVSINADVQIGKHCIINTNASVDHDCILGDFVHISPNAALCGDVHIGEGTHIGAGAVIIPGIRIGKWCTIGAGAVIIRNIPDHCKFVGNPGNQIQG
ncbi:acetyltransferase [Chitinophagaceae bacterium LB-8]|uniref:Acetyltransferase n=1 Tax=Paraflavisolibacter caeni TaxID=2982496 RepID=A0A9X3BFA4_9BACT|nr:acetyltransferase [Paraflavisolibacter caeni]MCU7548484.1 acetyltransferase [Paraflavisolibacter caeni]